MIKRSLIILPIAVALLSLSSSSAKASAPSCSVVLLDLAGLKIQIETEKDPTVASALKRAYQTKLKEARTRQIDLATLGILSDDAREAHEKQKQEQHDKNAAIEEKEDWLSSWPLKPLQLPSGAYTNLATHFWNRYVVDYRFHGPGAELVVWNMQTAEIIRTIPFEEMKALGPNPDGRFFIKGMSADGRRLLLSTYKSAILYNLEQGKEEFKFTEWPGGEPTSIPNAQLSADGSKVVLDNIRGLQVWDVSKSTAVKILNEDEINAWGTYLSPDGARLLRFQKNKRNIDAWDLSTQTHLRTQHLQLGDLGSEVWSPDGKYLAIHSRGGDYRLEIYDVSNGARVAEFKDIPFVQARSGSEPDLKFSADSSLLVTKNQTTKKITVWDIKTESKKIEVGDSNYSRLSPDGRFLFVGDYDSFTVYDVNNNKALVRENNFKFRSMGFAEIKGRMHMVFVSDEGLVTAEGLE